MRSFLAYACGGLSGLVLLVLPRAAHAQDLSPPPPVDPPPASTETPKTPEQEATAKELDKGEKQDSGRGLEFVYLNAEAGGSYINMSQFSSTTFGLTHSSSSGGMFGAAAGLRLFIFTIGARARLHELSAFNLWQVDGEAGIHIPAGHWDPYLTLHAGYSFVGTLSASALEAPPALPGGSAAPSPNVAVHGVNAGVSIGFDYYFNHFISLGVDATADALFLQRPPVALPTGPGGVALTPAQQMAFLAAAGPTAQQLYNQSGDSVGFGLSGSGHLGIHF